MVWCRGCGKQAALGCTQHCRDNPLEHVDCKQANLLEFVDFAEVGNADGEVGKGAVRNDASETLFVQSRYNVKRGSDNTFWGDAD